MLDLLNVTYSSDTVTVSPVCFNDWLISTQNNQITGLNRQKTSADTHLVYAWQVLCVNCQCNLIYTRNSPCVWIDVVVIDRRVDISWFAYSVRWLDEMYSLWFRTNEALCVLNWKGVYVPLHTASFAVVLKWNVFKPPLFAFNNCFCPDIVLHLVLLHLEPLSLCVGISNCKESRDNVQKLMWKCKRLSREGWGKEGDWMCSLLTLIW